MTPTTTPATPLLPCEDPSVLAFLSALNEGVTSGRTHYSRNQAAETIEWADYALTKELGTSWLALSHTTMDDTPETLILQMSTDEAEARVLELFHKASTRDGLSLIADALKALASLSR